MNPNRRKFMKTAGIGIAGSLLVNKIKANPVNLSADKGILTRTLGKTGLEIPIISLPVERINNERLFQMAVEAGIKYFDTAWSYGNGRSEEFLGRAMKPYNRESLILSTKISTKNKENPKKELYEKFETSLSRLQTTYVDILFLHAVDHPEDALNKDYIEVFQDLKKQGKAKHIGISTHSNMAGVIRAAVSSNVWEVVLTTYNFRTMQNPQDVKAAIDEAHQAGLGIIAMKTMAGVFLDKERTQKINSTAALKWVLNNPAITTSVPGITSFEQFNEDIKLLTDITLTAEEKEYLANSGQTAGLFCQGCENCLTQCPLKVPVPHLMRAYMYAYGYQNTRLAQKVISEIDTNRIACETCPECTVDCTQQFNIRQKVADIMRIKDIPEEFLV